VYVKARLTAHLEMFPINRGQSTVFEKPAKPGSDPVLGDETDEQTHIPLIGRIAIDVSGKSP
jgi:hypothetical protein